MLLKPELGQPQTVRLSDKLGVTVIVDLVSKNSRDSIET